MGQYWHAMTLDGRKSFFDPRDYDQGLKLMEHCYVGNNFVNAIYNEIVETSKRVAWIGDYADERHGSRWEKKFEGRWDWFNLVTKCDESERKTGAIPLDLRVESRGWYLCNEDMKEYVDLEQYYAASKWHEEYDLGDNHYSYDSCIDPLPLLTACGNGNGGGDYYSSYPCYEMCGRWAFDRIRLTRVMPDEYVKIEPIFTEQYEVVPVK